MADLPSRSAISKSLASRSSAGRVPLSKAKFKGWAARCELPAANFGLAQGFRRGWRKNWSGRRGSNPRPRPWQGRALPLSYTRIRLWRRSRAGNGEAMPNADRECNSSSTVRTGPNGPIFLINGRELAGNNVGPQDYLPAEACRSRNPGFTAPWCRGAIRAIARTSPPECWSIRHAGQPRNRRSPTIRRTPGRHRRRA